MWPGMFHATAVLERAMTAVSTTVSEPIKVAISSFDLIGSTHDAMQPITFQEGATKPIELDGIFDAVSMVWSSDNVVTRPPVK